MDELRFSEDPTEMDAVTVHRWLSEYSYWARGRTLEAHRAAMAGSRNFGVFDAGSGSQLGYARVITDGVTFGWLADVFVTPDARGRGVGKALVAGVVTSLAPLSLKRLGLSTADAHGLYEQFGFTALPDPEHWMVLPGPSFGRDAST